MERTYQRNVALITFFSGVLALVCMLVGLMVVEYDFEAFSTADNVLKYAVNHQLFRWFLILDMFGYYLLLIPIIFFFHIKIKTTTPWSQVITFCGLGYVLVGAIGAAVLAAVEPHLMQSWLQATSSQKEGIAVVFETVFLMVYSGLWNLLETIFAGIWWIGLGLAIHKTRPVFGWITLLVGLSSLLDGLSEAFGWKMIADFALNGYLVLAIVWPLYIGVLLLREKNFSLQSR